MLKRILETLFRKQKPEPPADLEGLAEQVETDAANHTDLPPGAALERIDDVPGDGNPGTSYRLE